MNCTGPHSRINSNSKQLVVLLTVLLQLPAPTAPLSAHGKALSQLTRKKLLPM